MIKVSQCKFYVTFFPEKHSLAWLFSSVYLLHCFPIDKRITSKRKRALLIPDSSPEPGNMPTPRTPGGNISRITVPLSERQQMALLMRMTDGASQGGLFLTLVTLYLVTMVKRISAACDNV